MRIGAAVWGTLFLIIGGVLLLNSLNIVPWSIWADLLTLWPILLVVIGLLIIAQGIGNRLLAVMATLMLLGAAGFAVYSSIGSLPWRQPQTIVRQAPITGQVKEGNLRLVLGEGGLKLAGRSEGLLYRARLASRGRGEEPEAFVREEGDVAHVLLRQRERGVTFLVGSIADWDVSLYPGLPWDIDIDAGASRVALDLSNLAVRSLDLDLGAGDAEVRFGSRASQAHGSIDAGAARLKLLVPRKLATRVALRGGLSNTDIDFTLRKIATRGDRVIYQTDDWGSAGRRLDLEVATGVSQVAVDRY